MMQILYVEDDPVQATLVESILEDAGHRVTHVTNGFDAITTLEHTPDFDILLSDYYLPNMSGLDILQELEQVAPNLPTVILTSANDVSLAFSVLRAGAADFISKDSNGGFLEIINPVLERTLKKRQLEEHSAQLAKQLDEQKKLSHDILNTISQGVVVVNNQNTVAFCNHFFSSQFGLDSSQQAKGKPLSWLLNLLTGQETQANNALADELTDLMDGRLDRCLVKRDEVVLQLTVSVLSSGDRVISFIDITHQAQQLAALDQLIRRAPVAMIALDSKGRVVLVNERAQTLFSLTEPQLLNTGVLTLVPAGQRKNYQRLLTKYLQQPASGGDAGSLDMEILRADQEVPVEVSLTDIQLYDQNCVLVTIVDIRHRRQAEQALRNAHKLTQSIIENSPFSLVATDTSGQIIAVSPALERLLWYRRDELVGKHNAVLFHDTGELENRAAVLSEELEEPLAADFGTLVAKARRGLIEGTEWTYVRKNGSRLPVNLTVTSLQSGDKVTTGYLLVAYDISEQKKANAYIEHIAHHDHLTGLPNRTLMQDRLDNALSRVKRYHNKLAVLVMDLDRFKRINDSLGHMAGDQLLKTVAERLLMAVRESDTVCRMGGDEFVMILPDIHSDSDVAAVCQKILALIAKPVQLGLNSILVTPSIGVSIAPQDGQCSADLLKHADLAMYHAKQKGRNGYQVFRPHMASETVDTMALEQAFHEAFRRNQIEVFYQPQINCQRQTVHGFEALVRWTHPSLGPVSPDQFIPLIETTGFIIPLGEWVLRKACKEIQQLRAQHQAPYRLGVNVSSQQFEHPKFAQVVQSALEESGLPADALDLEITESLLLSSSEAVTAKLKQLHQLGVHFTIDDFGTGYSNLCYVSQYPISVIKIDRAFMHIAEPSNRAIVNAIIAMARALAIELIAEGVETAEQLAFINNNGCELIQGFYYSPAIPLAELPAFIAQEVPAPAAMAGEAHGR